VEAIVRHGAKSAIRIAQCYGGLRRHAVLSDIDLTVHAGERVALMGRSGAGKSTLLGLLYDQNPVISR